MGKLAPQLTFSTTTDAVARRLGLRGTLLGFDAVLDVGTVEGIDILARAAQGESRDDVGAGEVIGALNLESDRCGSVWIVEIGATCVGAAQAVLDMGVDYIKQRHAFGRIHRRAAAKAEDALFAMLEAAPRDRED